MQMTSLLWPKLTVNFECITNTLHKLKHFTGLNVNENKSTFYFSKGATKKQQIVDILNVSVGNLPLMYLDISLSNNVLKARDFRRLIDKINKKIKHWSNKLLNISG